jgi:uroporphyrin-III C-methyltransferase
MRARVGTVYLVGAGPGDADLLTVRAARLLREAEVLAPDALIAPAILALAPARAERIPVGYRCGAARAREVIHPLIVERARAGRDVVRLKAGDPMVFGRGAEEAEALRGLGIPFEIVPGVTAASGAAAAAGIPLTDRRCAGSVTFTTGHSAGRAQARETRVLYMARKTLRDSLGGLMESGCGPTTPAAMVAGATRPEQRIVVGTVADLTERVADVALDDELPALFIVGDVVSLRERLT